MLAPQYQGVVTVREEDEVPADLRYSAPLYRLAGEDAVVAAVLGERQPDLLTLPAPSYRLFSQVSHVARYCDMWLAATLCAGAPVVEGV